MDLDQFLENDILEFLEGKLEKKEMSLTIEREEDYGLYLTKDYEKEVKDALNNDNLSKAKKLFDELKEVYNTYNQPYGKKKIYAILEKIYSSINEYIDKISSKHNYSVELTKKTPENINSTNTPKSNVEGNITAKKLETKEGKVVQEIKLPDIEQNKNKEIQPTKKEVTEQRKEEKTINKEKITQPVIKQSKENEKKEEFIKNKPIETLKPEKNDIKKIDIAIKTTKKEVTEQKKDIFNNAEKVIPVVIKKHQSETENEENYKTEMDIFSNIKPRIIRKEISHENNKHKEPHNKIQNANLDRTVDELYSQGLRELFSKKYIAALQIFEKILEIKPNSKSAKIRISQCKQALMQN